MEMDGSLINFTVNLTKWKPDDFGETLLVTSAFVVGFQLFFCFLGTCLKLDKVKDLAGGVTFMVVALVSFFWQLHWKTLQASSGK